MGTHLDSLEGHEDKFRHFEDIQRATLNILEDFDAETKRLAQVQGATLNVLDDFDVEKKQMEDVQRATLNILEDFDTETKRLAQVHGATLNVLEDFDAEKKRLEDVQRATINIVEDFNSEKTIAQQSQRALLNIFEDLQDMYVEKSKLAEVNHQLEVANKELEAFSYSVSHDLRSPLRTIDGFSQALLDDYADKLDCSGQDHLQRVRRAAQRMAALIDDMLNLSRVTRSAMRREMLDLSAMAMSIAAELREAEPGRQVEFAIENDLTAAGDPQLVRAAMENLMGNAWKYTSAHPSARIEFGTTQRNGKHPFFVRDDGAGFDPRYAHRLFGAFQRLHTAAEFPGTGVGLATVQRIVHRHGGEIWAEGVVEKGATFYFTL
jgi:light-regulated signal transduction histidine kinase (bacteriophytochrome)